MRILVINPNSTESMTTTVGRCAAAVVSPGVRVDAVSAPGAPPAIESHTDEALAVPGVLEQVRYGEAEGYDAYLLARFGELATPPVREPYFLWAPAAPAARPAPARCPGGGSPAPAR